MRKQAMTSANFICDVLCLYLLSMRECVVPADFAAALALRLSRLFGLCEDAPPAYITDTNTNKQTHTWTRSCQKQLLT
jgi:hypothetical protein